MTTTFRYEIWDGTCLLVAEGTRAGLESKARSWCRNWVENPVIIRTEIMPDGHARVGFPWAGGTWGGLCGSTFWIDDPDGHIDHVQHYTSNGLDISVQRQHHNWINGSPWFPERKLEKPWAWGFRVECQQPWRHDAPCSEGPWRWTWRDDLRFLSNRGRRTGVHTLDELLVGV